MEKRKLLFFFSSPPLPPFSFGERENELGEYSTPWEEEKNRVGGSRPVVRVSLECAALHVRC